MQRNKGHHSKGKGKDTEKKENLADRMGELSLEGTNDPSLPRSGLEQYDYPSHPTSNYTNNNAYTHQYQDSHSTPSALAYNAGYEGYVTASPPTTTGRASSYESDYAASGYAESSSYASSYAPSSYASSGYAQSYASTAPSTVPPRYQANSVDHHIAQQPPPRNRYELPCEFRTLTGCTVVFQGGEEREWKEHLVSHLDSKFPTKLRCCEYNPLLFQTPALFSTGRLISVPMPREGFCETFTFDANDHYCGGDKFHNFERRMEHIRDHIMDDGHSASNMRPDGGLIRHLRHERIISSQTYDKILQNLNPTTVPSIPGSRSATPLDVVEEPASSSRTRRQERKEKHESSKKKHRR